MKKNKLFSFEEMPPLVHCMPINFVVPWDTEVIESHPLASELLNSDSNASGYSETYQLQKKMAKGGYVKNNDIPDSFNFLDGAIGDIQFPVSKKSDDNEDPEIGISVEVLPVCLFRLNGVSVFTTDRTMIPLYAEIEMDDSFGEKFAHFEQKYGKPFHQKHTQPLSRRRIS